MKKKMKNLKNSHCFWRMVPLTESFFKKKQLLLSPLGYFDVAFFNHADNISASAIILRCTSGQVQ